MNKPTSLTIVMPALNEEQSLEAAIAGAIDAVSDKGIEWEITLINDGSTDRTRDIADALASKEPRIKVIHHPRPMGLGYSFREGVEKSSKDVITWLPGDNEGNPYEILKYLPLMEHVDIVVPFVINPHVRSWGRRFLSGFFVRLINLIFGTRFHYTNGNPICRRSVFEVVKFRSNGFFFMTECLIKAVRAGFLYAEVPIRLEKRLHGDSKLMSFKSLFIVFRDLFHLFITVYVLRKTRVNRTQDVG